MGVYGSSPAAGFARWKRRVCHFYQAKESIMAQSNTAQAVSGKTTDEKHNALSVRTGSTASNAIASTDQTPTKRASTTSAAKSVLNRSQKVKAKNVGSSKPTTKQETKSLSSSKVTSEGKAIAKPRDKPRRVTKADHLISMISKPNGAQLSILCTKLDWQPHSIRGTISTLRKMGRPIELRKTKFSREAVYAIRSTSVGKPAS